MHVGMIAKIALLDRSRTGILTGLNRWQIQFAEIVSSKLMGKYNVWPHTKWIRNQIHFKRNQAEQIYSGLAVRPKIYEPNNFFTNMIGTGDLQRLVSTVSSAYKLIFKIPTWTASAISINYYCNIYSQHNW